MELSCLVFVYLDVIFFHGIYSCHPGVVNNVVLINGNCYTCPSGLFGVNCSQVCPEGYYGLLCDFQCYCTVEEFCHPIEGCVVLAPNGDIISKEDNRTTNGVQTTNPTPSDIHYLGLTIQHWFWTSVGLLAALVISLMVTCCSCERGRKKDVSYEPRQILDILSAFSVNGTGEQSTAAPARQTSMSGRTNVYTMDEYSEVDYTSVRSPPLSIQRELSYNYSLVDAGTVLTSNDEARAGGMNNYSVAQNNANSLGLQASPFKVHSDNSELGYNSLSLRANTSGIDGSYAHGNPPRAADTQLYQYRRKSVIAPVMRFGGRISQYFADRFATRNNELG